MRVGEGFDGYICGADLEFFQLSFHTITQNAKRFRTILYEMMVDDALFPLLLSLSLTHSQTFYLPFSASAPLYYCRHYK